MEAFKNMIDANYLSICELLPSDSRSVHNLTSFAKDYIKRMKEDFKKQPENYARFSQRLQTVAYRRISVLRDYESGRLATELNGVARGEIDRIRASFLSRKFEGFDELPGLVDAEEELEQKWCGFLAKVGGTLSGSGRFRYELLLRLLSFFSSRLINRCELGVVVADMFGESPDLMQEFGSLLPPLDHDDEDGDGEDGSKSDLTEEKGRKRKRIAEAAEQRKKRNKAPCRQITKDEEDEMNYAYILEYQLAEAIRYASQVIHGTCDKNEWSAYFRTRKAYFHRIVEEMYDDEGPEVLAMTEEDLADALPAAITRLQQKAREHACGK